MDDNQKKIQDIFKGASKEQIDWLLEQLEDEKNWNNLKELIKQLTTS